MGATGWSYFVPYEDDIERALQALRDDIFRKGDYYRSEEELAQLDDSELLQMMPSIEDLRKLLAVSEAIDQTMKEAGADTVKTERDTAGVRKFVERAAADGVAAAVRGVQREHTSRRTPQSMGELLEASGESGTHSILDIAHVSNIPGFGVAAPLNDDELLRIFGTTHPSKSMVSKAEQSGALIELREPWQGTYVIVYDHDQPSEILFTGASGD